jgi:hypothetical protein
MLGFTGVPCFTIPFDFLAGWCNGVGGKTRVNQNDDYVDIQRDKQFPYMHSLALPTQCATFLPMSSEFMLLRTGYELCCRCEFMILGIRRYLFLQPNAMSNTRLTLKMIVSCHVQLIIFECCSPLFSVYMYPDAST